MNHLSAEALQHPDAIFISAAWEKKSWFVSFIIDEFLLRSHIWARCFSIKQPVMSDWFYYRNCH